MGVFDSIAEYEQVGNMQFDWVEIKSDKPLEGIPYSTWGTKLITWRKSIGSSETDGMSEKQSKKYLKALRRLSNNGYTTKHFEEIPQHEFNTWFNEIYNPFIRSKGKEDGLKPDWNTSKTGKRHQGLFVFDEKGVLCGASYFQIKKDGGLSSSFKSVRHGGKIDINPALEQKAYEIASKLGSPYISKGVDYNLYGADLNIGLSEYKFKYGFKPLPYLFDKEGANNPSYYRQILITKREKFDKLISYSPSEELSNLEKVQLV